MKRTWLWVGAAALALAVLYLPSLGIGLGQVFVFLLVLLCPLVHLLGGHRHAGHGSGDSRAPGAPPTGRARPGLPTGEKREGS